jgi:2TM domain
MNTMSDAIGEAEFRERAVGRLRKRAEFRANVLAYVLVNSLLVGNWAVTGAGFFWPVFPILGWSIGLAFHAWDVYRGEHRRGPTEEQIRREIKALRLQGSA